jgi:N-acetylglutamate synthase-like GNAT family acetyltransferase
MKMYDGVPLLDFTIRKASVDDANQLFSLVSQFATSFKPEQASFNICLKELLSDESAWFSVVEYQGEVIGYCLGFDHYAFYANGRVAWVEEIMVKAEMRRHRVGRRLMGAFEIWAQARGSKLVGLATRRAASFYTALGYEESAIFFRKLL